MNVSSDITPKPAMATATLLSGLRGQYRVMRLIAEGGMARVYLVQDVASGHTWALKELYLSGTNSVDLANAQALFRQEAELLGRLNHPNLPEVHDFFVEAGQSYLVMEYIQGETLERLLSRQNAPSLQGQVLRWAVQLCDALNYLHNQNPAIIFRDLKPSNIMVTPQDVIKLIDFGIARTYKVNARKDTVAMGTQGYAAPEQFGRAQSDARTDLYALGATLYHLLSNQTPPPAIMESMRPPSLGEVAPGVSPALVAVVDKAMAWKPEDRFQTARQMRSALEACFRPGEPIPVPDHPAGAATTAPAPVTLTKPCPQCGHQVRVAARFCPHCGYSFAGLRPAFLQILQPAGQQWRQPIKPELTPYLLGRGRSPDARPMMDLSFFDPDLRVSRHHAQIGVAHNQYTLTDLHSSNGTTLNGQPVRPGEPVVLHHGDRIGLAYVIMQFSLSG